MAKVPPPAKTASRKGAPPPPANTVGNLDKPAAGVLKPLNFKVSESFKRDMKRYAADQGMSMVDVLKEGFELVKIKRGQ